MKVSCQQRTLLPAQAVSTNGAVGALDTQGKSRKQGSKEIDRLQTKNRIYRFSSRYRRAVHFHPHWLMT